MTNRNTGISLRNAALTAGFGLLFMAILGPYAYLFVIENMVVSGDAAATANNIMASEWLFRSSIGAILIVVFLDVVVAWALYIVLRSVNKSLSLLAAWFRLAYAAVFASALANLFDALQLLSGAEYLSVLDADQLHAQVMSSINSFDSGWNIGLAIFGLHLVCLGFLVFKSGFFPKFLGILVMLAGTGYAVDAFGTILVPDYDLTLAMYTFIGEVLLIFWLLWRGFRGFSGDSDRALGDRRTVR